MTYFADERIDIAAGATATLDRDAIDNNGGSRAALARIENSTAADSDVLYRFTEAPTASPVAGHRLVPGAVVEISGYTNLLNLVLLGAGGSASSVFISYAA